MENLNFSFINIISILALFTSLLFSFQIYSLKKKNIASRFFAFFLISISIIILFFLVLNLKQTNWSYVLLPLLMLVSLSLGPILWIYVRLVTAKEIENKKKHFYVPTIYSVVVLILLLLTQFSLEKTVVIYIIKALTAFVLSGLTVVFLTQNIYYISKIYRLYNLHLNSIGNTYSYTEKVNLKWFRLLIFGYIVFIFGLAITNFIDDNWSYILFYLIILFYVIYSGYNALNQDPIFKLEEKEQRSSLNLSDAFLIDLEKSLLTIMKEEQLFLDSSLTIFTLAKRMNTNSKYLSFLINKSLGKNFVQFVNEYRVEAAKQKLLDPKNHNLTIEYIGNESGFKSKSAFNAAFKKITKLTPSVYKKNKGQ